MDQALYHVSDIINGLNSNIIASQAVFLTIVSAYLVVSYSVGRDLTKYQAGFISLVFLMLMIVDYFATASLMQDVYELHEIRMGLQGEQELNETLNETVSAIFVSIRLVITIGALIFMWQVRRSKS